MSDHLRLQDHGDHGSAERAADLLHEARGAGCVGDPIGAQAQIGGRRYRNGQHPDAGTTYDEGAREKQLAGVQAGLRVGEGAGNREGQADQHDRPRPHTVRKATSQTASQQHAGSLWGEQQTCHQGTLAAQLLEVEGHQEHPPVDGKPGQEEQTGRRRERALPKEPQVDERFVRGVQGMEDEGDQQGETERKGNKNGAVGKAAFCRDLGEPVDQGRHGRGEQRQSQHIEALRSPTPVRGQAAPSPQQANYSKGNVDPEDPVPVQMADDQAADDGTEHRADERRQGGQGHRPAERAPAGRLHDEVLEDRQHQSGSGALHDSKGDQAVHVPGQAAEHRARQEQPERGKPQALATEAPHRPATDRDDHGKGQQEGRHHPLDGGDRGLQVAADRRDGYVDDREVQDRSDEADEQDGGELDERRTEALVVGLISHG